MYITQFLVHHAAKHLGEPELDRAEIALPRALRGQAFPAVILGKLREEWNGNDRPVQDQRGECLA